MTSSSESVLLKDFKTKRSLQEAAGCEPSSMEAQSKRYFHRGEMATPANCYMMASHELR